MPRRIDGSVALGARRCDGLDVQVAQLSVVHSGWRARHEVHRLRSLRERHHLANGRLAAEDGNDAVQTKRDAPMGWRAVFQRFEEEAETGAGLFLSLIHI